MDQKEPDEVLAICGLFAKFMLKNYVIYTKILEMK